MKLSCDDVRDFAPDLLAGRTSTKATVAVQQHIASCRECAAELDLAREVALRRTPAPAGLHDRVVAEVVRQRSSSRLPRVQLAIAASVALLLFGGRQVLILKKSASGAAVPSVQVGGEHRGPGWISVESALNTGAASLGDLSEEQLRQLLTELES